MSNFSQKTKINSTSTKRVIEDALWKMTLPSLKPPSHIQDLYGDRKVRLRPDIIPNKKIQYSPFLTYEQKEMPCNLTVQYGDLPHLRGALQHSDQHRLPYRSCMLGRFKPKTVCELITRMPTTNIILPTKPQHIIKSFKQKN